MRGILQTLLLAGVWGVSVPVRLLAAGPGESGPETEASTEEGGVQKEPGTVLTFYGLLKLERNSSVSDTEKLQEWQEFIGRAKEQIAYAEKAVFRWKNAARTRLVEAAAAADVNPEVSAEEKVEHWQEVTKLYPRTQDGRHAKKRVTYWQRVETKRRAEAAEEVERARRPKVERIQAWTTVLDWAARGPKARAAERRVNELARQLYAEAMNVDRIARIDIQTKLAAWRDVLAGRPNTKERRMAERRVAELEAEVQPSPGG